MGDLENALSARAIVKSKRQYRRVFKRGVWVSELRRNNTLESVLRYLDAQVNGIRGGFYTGFTSSSGVSAFFGSWPGEETDDELMEALAEIRH